MSWPLDRLGEALCCSSRAAGLATYPGEIDPPPVDLGRHDPAAIGRYVEAAGSQLGLEVETILPRYGEAPAVVRSGAPALVEVRVGGEIRVLVLLSGGRRPRLLDPSFVVHRVKPQTLVAALCYQQDARAEPVIAQMLANVSVTGRQRRRLARVLRTQRLGARSLQAVWLLRSPPGAGVVRQLRSEGIVARLVGLVVAFATQQSLFVVSWWFLGRTLLRGGGLDLGWLAGWVLLLWTLVPFHLLTSWLSGVVALDIGAFLKHRFLAGALRLHPDEVRPLGIGRFLGQVFESEAMESLVTSGGVLGLMSVVEVVIAFFVLTRGVAPWMHGALLALAVASLVAIGWLYLRRYQAWTRARLEMTYSMVENMVGHRTRLVQEPLSAWHGREDRQLDDAIGPARALDRTHAWLTAMVPRGWMLGAVVALAPALWTRTPPMSEIAVTVGGVLLAARALSRAVSALANVSGAWVAWTQVAPTFLAAGRRDHLPAASVPMPPADARPSSTSVPGLIEARRVGFAYRNRTHPVLDGCSLSVGSGDRVLLTGASGSGKSTLGSLLAGLRSPQSGVLLVAGLDRATLGLHGWTRRVASVPQFHDNHVFAATFAFNLLMGRRWPALPGDLEDALHVCIELGLGPLLERMPAGLDQQVGETGWQLSHGERSRLFIARALLQGSRVVVLDESFAALDPETLSEVMQCVLDRADALVVIAHP